MSTLTPALPNAPETAGAGQDTASPGTATDQKTILLLDGAQLFLKLEETLLQRSNWTIVTAQTAAEARRIIEERKVDLLLTDYALPDATGDEMVTWIRSRPETKDMGVLIVTARGMRDHVDRCMKAGCNSFLYKPISRSILSARVQELLHVAARRQVRTLVRLEVKAQVKGRFFFGNSVNLSANGVLLETNLDLALGDTIAVRFFLPGDEQAINTEGRVTRRQGPGSAGTCAYGLTFDRLSPEDRSRLEMFVETSRLFDPVGSAEPGL